MTKSSNSSTSTLTRNPCGSRSPTTELAMPRPQRSIGASYTCDPPPGAHVVLHARLRQSLDAATDDERHWAFRAIAATNAVAAQNRIKKACSAKGLGMNSDRRALFLLRNTPWPTGPKTADNPSLSRCPTT